MASEIKASVTYGKCIMANVIMTKVFMAKILWQMKLTLSVFIYLSIYNLYIHIYIYMYLNCIPENLPRWTEIYW